ncbi:MAG: hypothetical protein ACYC9L_02865 [Sulfuricaulis sp.]
MNEANPKAGQNEPLALSDAQIRDINEAWILALKSEGVRVRIIERCHLTVNDAIDNSMS